MDAQAFWEVIGAYNQSTWPIQIFLLILLMFSIVLVFRNKLIWLPKITLGVINLFIGIAFFLVYGTEPIQTYFASPLYIATGALFLYEGIRYRQSAFDRFHPLQWALLCLIAAYPAVSMLTGHAFPQLVVYIMPCPVISISIVVYTGYRHQNKLLLALMTIWGLTGIKAFFVNAYEDIILLICGIYCLYVLIRQFKKPAHA